MQWSFFFPMIAEETCIFSSLERFSQNNKLSTSQLKLRLFEEVESIQRLSAVTAATSPAGELRVNQQSNHSTTHELTLFGCPPSHPTPAAQPLLNTSRYCQELPSAWPTPAWSAWEPTLVDMISFNTQPGHMIIIIGRKKKKK